MAENDANTVVVDSSSTAEATAVEQEIPSAGSERIEWQKTGKITPKAAPTPASEASPKAKAESAAASEAAPQEKSRDNAATRLQEILADLKTAGLSPAELKTFKREAAKTQAESSPAKPPEVKPVELAEPKEPDMNAAEYQGADGWTKYEADVRKYTRELAKYEAAKAVENYKTGQRQAEELSRVQQQIKTGREKYQDFDQKAEPIIAEFSKDLSSPVSQAIGTSPVFEHLIYTIGGDSEAFIKLAKENPLAAVKRVGVLEALILEELKGSAKETPRDDKTGQFQSAPEKKAKAVSSAPAPPAEVGGKGTPPADEVEAALESGNQSRYNELMNARDLARRKR